MKLFLKLLYGFLLVGSILLLVCSVSAFAFLIYSIVYMVSEGHELADCYWLFMYLILPVMFWIFGGQGINLHARNLGFKRLAKLTQCFDEEDHFRREYYTD